MQQWHIFWQLIVILFAFVSLYFLLLFIVTKIVLIVNGLNFNEKVKILNYAFLQNVEVSLFWKGAYIATGTAAIAIDNNLGEVTAWRS